MGNMKVERLFAKKDKVYVLVSGFSHDMHREIVLWNPIKNIQMDKIGYEDRGEQQIFTFHVKPSVDSLGTFGVYEKDQGKLKQIAPSLDCFEKMSFQDYDYNIEADLYMRCVKNSDGHAAITISRARKLEGREDIQIADMQSGPGWMKFYLEEDVIGDSMYRFYIVPAKIEGLWVQPCEYNRDNRCLYVDMNSFLPVAEEKASTKGKWRIYLEVIQNGIYYNYRLKCNKLRDAIQKESEDFYDTREICQQTLYSFEKEGERFVFYPYFTTKGNIALLKTREDLKYKSLIVNKVTKLFIKKNNLKMEIEAHKNEMDICGLSLKFRTKNEEEAVNYVLPVKVREKVDGRYLVICEANLNKLDIRPLYWDISLLYKKEEIVYETRITNLDPGFQKKYFQSFFSKNTMKLKNGEIFYPYMTVTGFLAFQCRKPNEYDSYGFKLKERLAALIYFILKPYWINKNIYLVFEKFCVMAQDNGYYFFQYCMENNMEEKLNRKIYYVMDRKSPDWNKLQKYKDRVIPFMSLKHMVYLLASKLLISTDTRDHVYAWRTKESILAQYLDSKKLVFLQHGVIALKQVHFLYSNDRRGRCNIFITSNDMERDIIYNFFGYKMKQIAVTGLARWDVLKDCSEGRREILVMPTWRNWLDEVDDNMFKSSDYYKNYMSFLNSEKLNQLLENYDIKLNFYLHPKFREYIGDFQIQGDRIRLIPFGEEPLNELMMKCKLLVTDYSSVCWDVFYQGKPVVFYQFDMEQYNQAHGSYIDLETDLFGDRVEKQDELIALLEEYAKTEFVLKEKYANMRKDCYKYIDHQNSQRICDEIQKHGW